MNVYVVIWKWPDDWEICKVFSLKEKAEEYIRTLELPYWRQREEYQVKEFTVDG